MEMYYQDDCWTALAADVAMLQQQRISCVYCCGEHLYENCPSNPDSMCYAGNGCNAYSSTHNNEWMQQPNYSWLNQDAMLQQNEPTDPNFFQQGQQCRPPIPFEFHHQDQQQRGNPIEQNHSLEELLREYIAEYDAGIQSHNAIFQSQDVSLRNMENQIEQLADALNNNPQGSLPSDTEVSKEDKKEHCEVITSKSDKELIEPKLKAKSSVENEVLEAENEAEPVAKKLQKQGMECLQKQGTNAVIDAAALPAAMRPVQQIVPFPQQFQKKLEDSFDEVVVAMSFVEIGQPSMLKLSQVKKCRRIIFENANKDRDKTKRRHYMRLLQGEWKTRKTSPLRGLKIKHRWREKQGIH